ncbi:MAG: hypothetical protein QXX79_03230 [Candidatus Bathyarchaeia archaeon]
MADACQDRIARHEVFRLLAELEKEGKLSPKGAEWYLARAQNGWLKMGEA